MKIGVVSLAVGDKFREDVKYGIRSKVEYCQRHNYDFIDDDRKTDHSRHLAWSKIPVILDYLSKYDYLVWIDADTIITNAEIRLEDLITELLGDKELMYAACLNWVNTGVMFIKNTPYMHEFFKESWNHTDKMCWEQGAIDHLWRVNYANCREKIVVAPDQTRFNSLWQQWRWGQFIVHFPGCGEPNRPVDCLRRMIEMFCVLKMDGETDETFNKRIQFLKNSSIEIPKLYNHCMRTGQYVPLD